jgi:hypothetical protein
LSEQPHGTSRVRVHRGAARIAQRIRQVLDEPDFTVTKTYQWAAAQKFRHFHIGPNIAVRDDHLIEDLTGAKEEAA